MNIVSINELKMKRGYREMSGSGAYSNFVDGAAVMVNGKLNIKRNVRKEMISGYIRLLTNQIKQEE